MPAAGVPCAAGDVLDDVRAQAGVHGLTFGVDPSTHNRCTLGGMFGTNACGTHSVAWGTTADNVDTIDVVLADGRAAVLGSVSAGAGRTGVTTPRLLEPLTALAGAYLPELHRDLGRFPRQISGYGPAAPEGHRRRPRIHWKRGPPRPRTVPG